MKLTEKEKEQILKSWAEAMSRIIERMSIKMWELEEENKNLKSDLAFERTMLDNVRAEYKSLQNVIKNLEAELSKNKVERWSLKKDCENKIEQQKIALKSMENQIRKLKETLEHRDSILSIMYDLLRSNLGDYEQLSMIDVVIDVEVWNEPQNKLREELLDRFWKRDF